MLMSARPLDYHSRLIVDSVSIECLRRVVRKYDTPFSQKSTVSFAADATVVCFVLKRKFATALEQLSAAYEVCL